MRASVRPTYLDSYFSRARRVCAPISLLTLMAGAIGVSACSTGSAVSQPAQRAPARGGVAGSPATSPQTMATDMQKLYRSMGLLAGAGSIPFVSSLSFLQSPSTDSTLTLVALSMPSRSLGFGREGDRYTANYAVRLELRQGQTVLKQIEARETVRVPTFRETSRTDESVIWQQFLRIAPGRYTMSVSVKDESSIRTATEEVAIFVPRLAPGAIGSIIPVYEAIPRAGPDSLPRLLARPRSTVAFGQDSTLPVYIEAIGEGSPTMVHARLLGEGDQVTWQQDIPLAARGSARNVTVGIPVARMGIGITTLEISAVGRADTARTRILVSLGDDLPIASFDEMLSYLRYFTSADRLRALRDATAATRAEVWSKFLKDTDPLPATPEHEGLRDYFARIRAANIRFRDDGQNGWLSDRGIAFVGLGDPDNIYDSGANDPNARVRQQVWEYREIRLQLVFLDQSGFGRWRLSPQGMSDLQNAIRRRLAQRP